METIFLLELLFDHNFYDGHNFFSVIKKFINNIFYYLFVAQNNEIFFQCIKIFSFLEIIDSLESEFNLQILFMILRDWQV